MVVFGTNGMLINDRLARELVEIGVMGMGISIDSLDAGKHDAFRGIPGAWEAAVAGSKPASGTACNSRCISAPNP